MYQTPYGYPNAAAAGQMFNGAPPPQGAAHLQPAGSNPNQPQQMMYNTQQFPMAGQPGAFPAGPNPGLMAGAGPAGMMQNAAMPPMAANGQMAFQTPFTSSPYAAGIPSSAAPHQPQLPANFMMAGQMPPYPMGAGMPNQQQPMMQRMLPAQQNPGAMSVSTPQRQFNPQGTPTSSVPPQQQQQQQFSTHQPQGTPQSQTPATAQHPPASIATPQTPTFPTDQGPQQVNGTSASASAPQSPAGESRDKERFAVLLEINQELLYESIQLVNSRNELKKEQAAIEAGGAKNGDIDYPEEEKRANQDYNQCMRRLQANLTYMFALADRNKPANAGKPMPSSPAYLTPPPLTLGLTLRAPALAATPENETASASGAAAGEQQQSPAELQADRVERDGIIRGLYKRLQGLYPGEDPGKEPSAAVQAGVGGGGGVSGGAGAGGRPGTAPGGKAPGGQNGSAGGTPVGGAVGGGGQGQGQGQGSNHTSPAPTPGASGVSGAGGQVQMQGGMGTPLMGSVAAPGLVQMQS